MRDDLRPALAVALAGSTLSLATTRLLASQLYAVKPSDPVPQAIPHDPHPTSRLGPNSHAEPPVPQWKGLIREGRMEMPAARLHAPTLDCTDWPGYT